MSDKKKEALEFALGVYSVCLATVDGDIPQARIMEVAQLDEDFTVWFATSTASRKMGQIRENSNACVMFSKGIIDLKILGKAEIVTDKAVKDALYKNKWDRHYPEGKDDPNYAVLKVVPGIAEYRDMEKYGPAPENVL